MPSFWKDKQVTLTRVKISYWAKRIREGRDDALALERYAKYVAELEALKEMRPKPETKKEVVPEVASCSSLREVAPNFTVIFE